MVFEHRPGPPPERAAITSIAEKIGCAAETFRYWVRQTVRDGGRRPGLTTDERTRSSSSSARTPSCGGRMKSCVSRPHISRRRSSTAERSEGDVHRRPPGRRWGSTPSARSCLPIVYYERKARIRDPQRQPARVRRNAATLVEHITRVWGAPGGLWRSGRSGVAAAGGRGRGPLHGRVANAAPRAGRGGAGPGLPAEDPPGPHGRGTWSHASSPQRGRTRCGSPIRRTCDLAAFRVRGLRHRRLLAADRRLAGVELAAQRFRCAGAGLLRSPIGRSDRLHQSDPGVQYLAIRRTERLAEAGMELLVGSTGDSNDKCWPRR